MNKFCFLVMGLVLASCSSNRSDVIETSACGDIKDFTATQAQYYPDMIRLSGNERAVSLDLTQNQMSCRAPTDPILFSFEGLTAQYVQAHVTKFVAGTGTIHVRQVVKPQSQPFADFVTSTCRALKLPFTFSVDQNETRVIGCQSTDLSKSAVMWRKSKTSEAMVEIAALPIYTPVLDQVLGAYLIPE